MVKLEKECKAPNKLNSTKIELLIYIFKEYFDGKKLHLLIS